MPDYILPSISPDLPIPEEQSTDYRNVKPTYPNMDLQVQNQSYTPQVNLDDNAFNWGATGKSQQASVTPIFSDWDAENADRFVGKPHYETLGHDPFLGEGYNEEKFAQDQTGWEQFKNATAGAGVGFAHSAWDQFKSWKDVASVFQDGDLTAAFQKDELEEIAKKDKESRNQFPIYQSEYDRNNFFSWGNFYNQVQGSGHLIGSVAEMIAENAATMAIIAGTFGTAAPLAEAQAARDAVFIAKATNNAVKESVVLGKTIDKAANLKKAFQAYKESPSFKTALNNATAWSAQKIGKPVGEAMTGAASLLPFSNTSRYLGQGLIDAAAGTADIARSSARVRTVGKGVGAMYMDLRDLNLAISMAQGSASNTYHSSILEWKEDYRKKNGVEATGQDLQEIEELALRASKTGGALDAMTMLYTNKLAFGNILRGNNALKQVVAEQGSGILKGVRVVPEFLRKTEWFGTTGKGKLLANAPWYNYKSIAAGLPDKVGHGLGFGLTMGASAAIGEATKAYYNAKYNHKDIEWTKAFKQGIDSQFTKEGAQTFISGFLTGVLVPGIALEKMKHAGENLDYVYNREGYKKRTGAAKTDAKDFVDKYNDFYDNPLNPIRENLSMFSTQANIEILKELSARLKDTKLFNDLSDDALRSFIIPAIRNGHADLYIDHLRDFTENLTPKELFENLYPDLKYDDNADLAASLQHSINEFYGRTKDLDRIYKDVYRKFPNPFNPYKYKGDPEKFEKEQANYLGYQIAVDQAVFSKDIAERSIERQSMVLNGDGVNGGIRGMEIFKNTGFSTLYNFTDNIYLKGAIETLQAEVGALTGNEKTIAEAQLKAYTDYNETLLQYKEEYHKILNLKDGEEKVNALEKLDSEYAEKFKEPFGKVLEHELKQKGETISDTDKIAAVKKYLDYYKLGVESEGQLKFYNVIADPNGNWTEYTRAVTKAIKEQQEEQQLAKEAELGKGFVSNRYWVDDKLYTIERVSEDGKLHYTYEDTNGKIVKGVWTKEYFEENIKDKLYEEASDKTNLDSREFPITAVGGKSFKFRAGDIWVGPPKSDETGIWGDQETVLKRNNKIRIVEISKDGTRAKVRIDGGPDKIVTLQSVADLAEETNWVNYDTLTLEQKEFLNLRNFGIRYKVIQKDEFGKTIYNKNGKPALEEVTGRVALSKDKEHLFLVYNNERSGKKEFIPFNRKYVLNEYAIEPRSIVEKRAAEARQARLEANYNIQKTKFESLIRESEGKLDELQDRKVVNESKFQEHLKEMEALKKDLDVVSALLDEGGKDLVKEKAGYKGKAFEKTKTAKEYAKILSDLDVTKVEILNKLDRFQETLDSLAKEKEELLTQEEALKQSREFQYEVLRELEDTKQPFDRAGEKDLFTRLEQRADTIEEFRATRKPELVDQLLEDTRAEIKIIEDRMDILSDVITSSRNFLSKVEGLKDIYDEILRKASEGTRQLKRYLWELRESSDPTTRQTALDLFKVFSLSEGDPRTFIEAAYVKKIINEAQAAVKEFDTIAKKREALQEKEARLEVAKEQNVELTGLKERIEYLRKVQESLIGLSVKDYVPPKEIVWDEEKERSDKENKGLAQEEAVNEESGFFVEEPKFAFNGNVRTQFFPGVMNRTQGRQYEPEHLVISDSQGEAKLYIRRDGKKVEARVLDKNRYPRQRADFLQNLANHISKENPSLFDLEEGVESTHHYTPGKSDVKIKRFENDRQLNQDEKNAEAHVINANLNIKNIQLSVITADNDVYGIRNTDAFDDDIKVLYVNPEGKPIDMEGNVIANPTKENVIYRSLQGSTRLLDHTDLPDTLEGKTESETIRNIQKFIKSPVFESMELLFDIKRSKGGLVPYEDAKKVFEEIKRFKFLRDKLKEEVKQNGFAYLQVTGKSQGIPNYTPKVGGKIQKHSVEGRVTESDTDWRSPKSTNGMRIELKIANSSDKTTSGVKNGRLVWVREDGQKFPAENRQLSKAEDDNLWTAFKYYSKFHNKTFEQLELERGEKEAVKIYNDMDKLRTLFNSMTFWGVPSKKDIEAGKLGKNRLWVAGDKLYRSTKDGVNSILFVTSELEKPENRKLILGDGETVDKLFHQVNKKLLERNQEHDHFNVKENKDGTFSATPEPYDNYLHYLTSKVDEEGVPVVYTNIITSTTPKAGEALTLHTSLKQVNLLFQDDYGYTPTKEQAERNAVETVVEETKEEKKQTGTKSEMETSDDPVYLDNDSPFVEIMAEAINEPELAIPQDVGNGIIKYRMPIEDTGLFVFFTVEGELITPEKAEGEDAFKPRLYPIKESKDIEAEVVGAEPLVTSEPKVPNEPPKPEAEVTTEVKEEAKEPDIEKTSDKIDEFDVSLMDLTEEEKALLEMGKDCKPGINR